MIKFIYNNTTNVNISHKYFYFNYIYYLYMVFEKNIDYSSDSKITNKLTTKI